MPIHLSGQLETVEGRKDAKRRFCTGFCDALIDASRPLRWKHQFASTTKNAHWVCTGSKNTCKKEGLQCGSVAQQARHCGTIVNRSFEFCYTSCGQTMNQT